MTIRILTSIGATLLFLVLTVPAAADLILRYAPADTTVQPGDTGRLSIMCDEAIDLRTIDVRVQFDPSVVGSVTGGPGALFTDPGYDLFDGFELVEPGLWWGYSIVLGSTDWVTGPGELFYWEFSAEAAGTSPIEAIELFLAAPDASEITDASLPPTTITVDDVLAAPDETPGRISGFRCIPNPFNPRTEVRFDLAGSTTYRLEVIDLSGRRVRTLSEGRVDDGRISATWDGRDEAGRAQPAGAYLFRLSTPLEVRMTRGMLVR